MSRSEYAVSFETYGGSAAENYERYFVPAIGTPFAKALLEVADLGRGDRVLDVACGTGAVTRLAAERVGGEGAVTGVDFNPAMIAVARSAVPDPSIAWHVANAESIALADGSFDVVVCSLGLQFVADKEAALREMHRVLAPGGRLAVGTVAPTPVFDIMEQALARHLDPTVAAFMRQIFSLDDPAVLCDLLASAGFADVHVTTKPLTLTLPDPGEFLWQYAQSTPLAAAVAELSDSVRTALEHDVVAAWQSYVTDGSLVAEPTAVLSTGRKQTDRKNTNTADSQRPEDLHRRYVEAFNSGNVEPLLDLYEPGASLAPQPETVVSGHAAISDALSQYQAIGKMTAETRYCIQNADVALASASWSIEGTGPDGEPIAVHGTSADLLRRQSDGRWLLVVDHPFGATDNGVA